jgi:phage terminase small subunit
VTPEELNALSYEQLLALLNPREQKFVHVYDGNGVEAARSAGYLGNNHVLAVQGSKLMRKPEIRRAVALRIEASVERFILTREERQEQWSLMAIDEQLDAADRLKALELLGKSQADFTERLEVKGELTLATLVLESLGGKSGAA